MKEPQPQSPGRDLLGGHASLEFGDCSIAGSALNKSVTEMMAAAPDTRTVRYLGDENQTQTKQMLHGAPYATRRIALPGKNQVDLVFLQESVANTKKLGLHKPRRLKFRNSLPEETPAPKTTKSHAPILAAQIEDFVLPLATFNKTDEPGACGYVQIGSQPSDASIHTTSLDDRTPSFGLVEAMRSMLEKNAEDLEHEALTQLVSEQIQKHEEQVNREYERYLVQKLWREVSHGTAADLIVIDDSGETLDEPQKVIQAEYLSTTLAPDGRRIRLALVKAADEAAQSFQLQAVTRGKLGLPLGHFNAKDASFEPTAATLALGSTKESLIQTMLTYYLPATKATDRHFSPGYEASLLLGINQKSDYSHNTYPESYIPLLKRFLENPDIYPSPISNSVILDNAARYRNKQNEAGVELLNSFGTVQQLVEMHGQTTPHYEYFLDKLDKMFGDKTAVSKKGVMPNTRSGKTNDDIDVRMDFSRDGSSYQVKLLARPASMDKLELALVRQSMFDITLPSPDDQEIAALLDILDTIE